MEDAIASIASLVVTRVPSNARPRRRGRAFTFRPNIVSSVCVRACMRACVRACVCVCVCMLSVCMCVWCVSLRLSLTLPSAPSVRPPVYPSIRPSVRLCFCALKRASSRPRRRVESSVHRAEEFYLLP